MNVHQVWFSHGKISRHEIMSKLDDVSLIPMLGFSQLLESDVQLPSEENDANITYISKNSEEANVVQKPKRLNSVLMHEMSPLPDTHLKQSAIEIVNNWIEMFNADDAPMLSADSLAKEQIESFEKLEKWLQEQAGEHIGRLNDNIQPDARELMNPTNKEVQTKVENKNLQTRILAVLHSLSNLLKHEKFTFIAEMATASVDEWIQNSVQAAKGLSVLQVNAIEGSEREIQSVNPLLTYDEKVNKVAEVKVEDQSHPIGSKNTNVQTQSIGESPVLQTSEASAPYISIPLTTGIDVHSSSSFQSSNEKVEVVYARQFVQEVQTIMTDRLPTSTDMNPRSTFFLQLYPEHLGKVNVQLTFQNGQLTAQFLTETLMGRELIENHLIQLRQSLQHSGVEVDRLDVQMQKNDEHSFAERDQTYESFGEQRKKSTSLDSSLEELESFEFEITSEQRKTANHNGSFDVIA